MIDKSQQVQVFYEIAMAIGKSLDLKDMLKHTLLTYLRKLNCIGGAVFKLNRNEKTTDPVADVFHVPFTLNIKDNYPEIYKVFHGIGQNTQLSALYEFLPLSGKTNNSRFYHIMQLGDFGFLLLLRSEKFLDGDVLNALGEVNNKLSLACWSCVNNHELEERERHYKDLTDLLPEMICEVDLNGVITYANKYAFQRMGYSEEEIGNDIHLLTFFFPSEHERVKQNFAQSLMHSGLPPREYSIRKRNGESFPVLVHTNRVAHNNTIVGIRAVMIDITTQKENEQKLQRYNERLGLALLGSGAGLWDWNIATGEVFFDERWCSMLGYTQAEIDPNVSSWEKVVNPDDMPYVLSALKDHLAGKTPFYRTEHRVRTKSGHWLWILDTGRVTRYSDDGSPIRAVGTHIDITEKKNYEFQLQRNLEQEELLSEVSLALNKPGDFGERINQTLEAIGKHMNACRIYMFENSADGNMCSNTYEWCNKGIPSQMAYLQDVPYQGIPSFKEMLLLKGRIFSENVLSLPSDLRGVLEPQDIKSILVFPVLVNDEFFGFLGADEYVSEQRWSKSDVELLRSVSGALGNAFERRQMELGLVGERDRANSANRAKSEFLANMSHEIRTPMNAILGFSEAVYHKVQDPQQKKMLQSVLNSGKHLMALLNDILDLSKLEAGKLDIVPQALEPVSLLTDLVNLFRHKAQKKGLELSLHISESLPSMLKLDEIRIKQVLFNLVGNAIKFTHQGYVNLLVNFEKQSPAKGVLTFDVEDTGIGIPAEERDVIFNAFKQYSGNITRKFGGVGLGLTISKRLVEQMGGSLGVISTQGQGSVFSMRLEGVGIVTAPNAEKRLKEQEPDCHFLSGHVLVVDDVPANVQVVQSLLSETNLYVSAADSGDMALEFLKHSIPDIVLLDTRMPGLSGYEIARQLKDDPTKKHIPLIRFSSATTGLGNGYKKGDFDDVLVKPPTKQELFALLARHLECRSDNVPAAQAKENQFFVPTDLLPLLPEILAVLQNKFMPRWESTKELLVLFEIEDFAKELQVFGSHNGVVVLEEYAQQIIEDVENLNIETLTGRMSEFPEIVSKFKSLIANND